MKPSRLIHRKDDPNVNSQANSFWRPRRAAGIAIMLLATAVPAFASPATFNQANQDFSAGHYLEAARGFEQVMAHDGYSVPLLFNAGNAWLKAGQPGRAILNYERAQVLSPRDKAVAHNLAFAREQAGLAVTASSTLQTVIHALSWNTLTWLALATGVVFCSALLVGAMWPALPKSTVRLTLAASAAMFLVFAGAIALRWPEVNRAVVLAADTPARIAPAQVAATAFTLPAGEIVQTRESHGDFVLIRTPEGRSGWVSKPQVANPIAPEHVPDSTKNPSMTSTEGGNT